MSDARFIFIWFSILYLLTKIFTLKERLLPLFLFLTITFMSHLLSHYVGFYTVQIHCFYDSMLFMVTRYMCCAFVMSFYGIFTVNTIQ